MKHWVLGLFFCVVIPLVAAEPGRFKVKQASGSIIQQKGKIQTGSSSRIELELPYLAIVRIGSNASVALSPDNRTLTMNKGTMLLSSPKDTGKATIYSGSVVTTLAGGDLQMSNAAGQVKVAVLNGKAIASLANNPSAKKTLRSGQMIDVAPNATAMPPVTAISLTTLLKTSVLFNMGPLPSSRAIQQNATSQAPPKPFITGGFDPDWSGSGMSLLSSIGPAGTAAMAGRIEAANQPLPLPVIPPGDVPTQNQAQLFADAGKPIPNVTTPEGRRILRGDRLAVLRAIRDRNRPVVPPIPVATPVPTPAPQPTRPPRPGNSLPIRPPRPPIAPP